MNARSSAQDRGLRIATVGLLLCMPVIPRLGRAQDSEPAPANFLVQWERRATEIQSEQPRWITPLVTVTPRLEQELRYDVLWRTTPKGTETTIIGNGKGLELIPFSPIELIIGVPAYTVHRVKADPDGWGDWPLLLKYRIISANEAHGNYILTAFLGGSVPTGGHANGSGAAIITPTIAGGKGWGDFDVQGTAGINLPTGNLEDLGHPILYNVAVQYRILRFFSPEVELNGTSWRDGSHDGRTQLFITPGLVVGRLPIFERLGVTLGAGMQIAATTYRQYDHDLVVTARVPF